MLVKRSAALKKIRQAAKAAGVDYREFELKRHTGLHVGQVGTTIRPHDEIKEGDAQALYKRLEPALGQGWWKT